MPKGREMDLINKTNTTIATYLSDDVMLDGERWMKYTINFSSANCPTT